MKSARIWKSEAFARNSWHCDSDAGCRMNVKRGLVCVVCKSQRVRSFLQIEDIPVFCNVQWSSRDEALKAASGNIDLVFCEDCGHVFNASFEPKKVEYTQSYENSLHFSPRFHAYAEALADRLIDKYDIRNKTVVDIGCGKGEFISMLCDAGTNLGYGFDMSYEENRDSRATSRSVTFLKDTYDERYADLGADLLCCRHVLEHIQSPTVFMAGIHRIASRNNALLYFEVPNALYSINDMGIWDFIYEHCSYFCMESIQRCFQLAGYQVLDTYTDFGDQFLCIESRPANTALASIDQDVQLSELTGTIWRFEQHYRDKIDYWNEQLSETAAAGKRVLLWGSGSKGVTFLNCVDSAAAVQAIVDVNPNKHGKFVSGTGHEILAPERLKESPPDLVIIMNPLYEAEISGMLSNLGLRPDVLCA